MKKILAIVLIAIAALSFGCKTTNPTTGKSVFDPGKTQQVVDALTPLASSPIRRALINSPNHRDEINNYLVAVAGVFCKAGDTGEVTPEQIVASIDEATAKLQGNAPAEIIDGKNIIVSLYVIIYGGRFKAELPEDQWPRHACKLVCNSIDQALKDAKLPGVK